MGRGDGRRAGGRAATDRMGCPIARRDARTRARPSSSPSCGWGRWGRWVRMRRRASAFAALNSASNSSSASWSWSVGGRRWMRAEGTFEDARADDARANASSSSASTDSSSNSMHSSDSRWGDEEEGGGGGRGRARARSARAKAKRDLRAYRFAEANEEESRESTARARGRGKREIRGGYFDGWEATGRGRARGTSAASSAAASSAFASSFASSFAFGGRGRGRGRARDDEDVERAFRAYAWARLRRGGRRSAFGGDVFADDAAFRDFFRAERGADAFARAGVGDDIGGRSVNAEGFYAGAECEHCETLGLRPNAFVTWDALKTALREQAVKWHPDRHAKDGDKSSAEIRFKRVYDAYDALVAKSPTR